MIIVGIILLVLAYVAPLPVPLDQIALILGWIFLVLGLILLVLGVLGRPVAGRRYWL